MGTISSGVGLISGLDIEDLVSKLMSIESRPQQLLEARVKTLVAEQTAFLQLSATILAAKSASADFGESSFFSQVKATSSDEDILTVSAGEGALPGSYAFTVHSLVSTHELVSSGFATADDTRVGAGTITIESAKASITPRTMLDSLNGGNGVGHGTIRITDRSGASTQIDLSTALTIDDVLDAINNQSAVNVTASVSGGHLVLTDETGQTTGNLIVSDVGLGQTASDLGIAGSVAGDVLTGGDVVFLTEDTSLSVLNDGNGVRRDVSMADLHVELRDGSAFDVNLSDTIYGETRLEALNGGAGVRLGTIRITNAAGESAELDLTGATDLADVQEAISGSGLDVTATLINSHILITDNSGDDETEGTLTIEDVTGHAAEDLGIAQEAEDSMIAGTDIYWVESLGDVLRAINYDDENTGTLVASISEDGMGITLTDTSAGSGTTTVTDPNETHAADDLGILTSSATGVIESRQLIAGPQTVLLRSLNGGQGVTLGTISVTARDGTSTQIDLTGLDTLDDVVEAINAVSDTSMITASVNQTGNGIVLTDLSDGDGNLVVADVTGSAAADLNLLVDDSVDQVDSGNLQLQYISETTRLDELNNGQGITRGEFTITDSSGASATIDLTQGNEITLADVIQEINARSIGVVASINENGDGLLLTDTAGGANQLTVTEEGSTTAADLGILGTAEEGETTIDGSFEIRVVIDSDDTLNDVVAKINSADAGVSASVLNDGSSTNPYRLILASETSGLRGEMVVDTGSTELSFSTLVQARDAVVSLGDPSSSSSILLTSSTNTLDDVVPNVQIDLLATSDSPVQVNVLRNVDGMVSSVKTFVKTFNTIIESIEDLTSFDTETYEKGALFGDSTVERIRQRLYSMVRQSVDTGGIYDRLSDIGLTLGDGAQLQLDEDLLREALTNHREDVEALFTQSETGIGVIIEEELTALTESGTGLIERRTEALTNKQELLNERIERMQILLDSKEQRLLNEYYAMEEALAQLDSIQNTLSSLLVLGSE